MNTKNQATERQREEKKKRERENKKQQQPKQGKQNKSLTVCGWYKGRVFVCAIFLFWVSLCFGTVSTGTPRKARGQDGCGHYTAVDRRYFKAAEHRIGFVCRRQMDSRQLSAVNASHVQENKTSSVVYTIIHVHTSPAGCVPNVDPQSGHKLPWCVYLDFQDNSSELFHSKLSWTRCADNHHGVFSHFQELIWQVKCVYF